MTLMAMALPNFNRGRMQANETAAVAAMRSVCTSIISYETTYQLGFPNNLAELGPPPAGTPPSAAAADLMDSLLASGTRSGYSFTYVASDTNGDGRNDAYTLHAPANPGVSGIKHFYVDATNVIRYNATGPAGPGDRPIPN